MLASRASYKKMSSYNLTILRSNKVEQLVTFYSRLLEVNFDEHTDHGPTHHGTQVGDVYLEIYRTKNLQGQLDGIGFAMSELEKALERVGKEHLHQSIQRNGNNISAMLKDPDGRIVFLTEQK